MKDRWNNILILQDDCDNLGKFYRPIIISGSLAVLQLCLNLLFGMKEIIFPYQVVF